MVSNALRQLDIYGELVKNRWPEVMADMKAGTSNGLQLNDKFKEEQQKNSSNSIAVLEAFDVKAAEILLDQEIREVVQLSNLIHSSQFSNVFQSSSDFN